MIDELLNFNKTFVETKGYEKYITNKYPDKKIIKLGIGDVTLPLCKEVVKALKNASEEMGIKESFHGYGPEQGYEFLKTKLQKYYETHGVNLDNDEIFISDGAK